jgi:hypothetical protein
MGKFRSAIVHTNDGTVYFMQSFGLVAYFISAYRKSALYLIAGKIG